MPFSLYNVTINTNHAANTAEESHYVVEMLVKFIVQDLGRFENWERLLTVEPSFDVVDSVTIQALNVETGAKRHFIHAHFNVLIEHRGKTTHRKMQRKLIDFANERMPLLRGTNVEVKLDNARWINYSMKSESAPGTHVFTQAFLDAVDF